MDLAKRVFKIICTSYHHWLAPAGDQTTTARIKTPKTRTLSLCCLSSSRWFHLITSKQVTASIQICMWQEKIEISLIKNLGNVNNDEKCFLCLLDFLLLLDQKGKIYYFLQSAIWRNYRIKSSSLYHVFAVKNPRWQRKTGEKIPV